VITKQQPTTLTNRLTDWQGFRELDQKIKLQVPLKTTEQLDNETEQFLIDLQQAAWNKTPVLKMKTPGLNYVREVREMVAEKRKARKNGSKRDVHRTKSCSTHFANNSNKKFAKLKMKVLRDS
jgi:hypothetical protein